ncbi:thiamine pyrophosphate-dependent dehydrogenase E1 component subunit alpha [Enterococcus ureilyticus]|nr:thiamine pyrophosphate-dependent dehydrogenase E1 component subunit alpha [Enterococcus ureilyticus]
MWEIRIFEEMIQELFDAGELYGTMHLCIGQEATAVGGAGSLKQTDWIVSTHRNHGHCIAKGTDIRSMFAEMLGKKTGTNEGKGGSMHIADLNIGNLGSNGIVGAGFPIAAGAALSAQMQNTDQVVLCYAGDGAVNEGSFHEALNLASIWKLPVIYLIENNQYGMSSSIEQMVNIDHLSQRGKSYGIEGITIDGNDLTEVSRTVAQAVEKARNGSGPTLIEALTYRHKGHSKSDKLLYRSEAECRDWQENNDPIVRLEKKLIQNGEIEANEIRQMEEVIRKEFADLLASVKHDSEPTVEDLWTHVYAEDTL